MKRVNVMSSSVTMLHTCITADILRLCFQTCVQENLVDETVIL